MDINAFLIDVTGEIDGFMYTYILLALLVATTPEDQVQGQTFFNMTNTLGVVISCFAGGVLLDWAGPQAALAFATLTGAGGMGLVWVLLGRKVPVAVAQHG